MCCQSLFLFHVPPFIPVSKMWKDIYFGYANLYQYLLLAALLDINLPFCNLTVTMSFPVHTKNQYQTTRKRAAPHPISQSPPVLWAPQSLVLSVGRRHRRLFARVATAPLIHLVEPTKAELHRCCHNCVRIQFTKINSSTWMQRWAMRARPFTESRDLVCDGRKECYLASLLILSM